MHDLANWMVISMALGLEVCKSVFHAHDPKRNANGVESRVHLASVSWVFVFKTTSSCPSEVGSNATPNPLRLSMFNWDLPWFTFDLLPHWPYGFLNFLKDSFF